MVHCLIRGDDAAFDTFTCTDTDPSHSATGAQVYDLNGNYNRFNVPGCALHASKRAGCNVGDALPNPAAGPPTGNMSPQDRVACKAQAKTESWDPSYCDPPGPGGCTLAHCGELYTTSSCSINTVVGSFDWKMSYAARQGCTPVGGVSFDPAAKDAATTGMLQGVYCPAAMQQGAPPKIDSASGALKGQRAWGDCYVPQTVVLGGHAVEAAP